MKGSELICQYHIETLCWHTLIITGYAGALK